ncbi:MAG: hypothetical protein V7K89_16365 [Nostoc sp.]|uniref:hypothetical protein n=1 Tax=Nostoc sp. TaxID=1180 RepID=UPI002FF71BF0
MTEIHNLSMMDAEYVPLAAQDYNPNLEHRLKIPTQYTTKLLLQLIQTLSIFVETPKLTLKPLVV